MGFLDRLRGKPEIRAETVEPEIASDVLLRALMDKTTVTKEMALEIPTIQACINLIANTISKLPIVLYRKKSNGDIEEVKDDPWIRCLNEDTGDTLTAKQFWRAMLEDYFLGKGGYAYIQPFGTKELYYVDERDISIDWKDYHPIFKEYQILVQGLEYAPSDFLKILRKTRDGMKSRSIIDDNPLVLSVAYYLLKFELLQAQKGGMKRGFLQAEKPITQAAMDALKDGFRRLYGDSDENVVVLNNGTTFKDASATPAELQLNENISTAAEEICKLFGVPLSMVSGSKTGNSMTENDVNQFVKTCVAIMTDIECSLNRDLSRPGCYWQFDTKELTRGSIRERYDAYKIGLEKNFLQIDEVREKEGLEPLGIEWLQLNLNTVLYDVAQKLIYTPNTNQWTKLGDGEKLSTESEGGEEQNESGTEG